MSKRVTVIVEGREYLVEVGDLGERPVRATVNKKTYEVFLPAGNGHAETPVVRPAVSPRVAPGASPTPRPAARTVSGTGITAPMPGDICEIRVKVGQRVSAGDVVAVLEAMKMKNLIHSAQDGVIASVEVSVGQAVDYGAVLVTFEQG